MLRFRVRRWLCAPALLFHAALLFAGISDAAAAEDSSPESNVLVVAKKAAGAAIAPASSAQSAVAATITRPAPITHPAQAAFQPAGRVLSLELPLKYRNFHLGDVAVKISPDDHVAVRVSSLATALKKIMKPQALTAIQSQSEPAQETTPQPEAYGGLIMVAKKAAGAVSSTTVSHLFPATDKQDDAGLPAAPPAMRRMRNLPSIPAITCRLRTSTSAASNFDIMRSHPNWT